MTAARRERPFIANHGGVEAIFSLRRLARFAALFCAIAVIKIV
ncbi:hypothetical protein [Burkholderia mayonis]|nr:hypothetical protein [Burkholderia mayonis]